MDLSELADRVERAAVDEQGSMILLALEAAFPKPASDYQPRREPNFSPEWSAWAKLDVKVRNFVQMGAFLDAAMTLIDDGAGVYLERMFEKDGARWDAAIYIGAGPVHRFYANRAHSAPLALTAATLRTKALGAVHTLEGGL